MAYSLLEHATTIGPLPQRTLSQVTAGSGYFVWRMRILRSLWNLQLPHPAPQQAKFTFSTSSRMVNPSGIESPRHKGSLLRCHQLRGHQQCLFARSTVHTSCVPWSEVPNTPLSPLPAVDPLYRRHPRHRQCVGPLGPPINPLDTEVI
nr:hypothetical protein CPAG_06670 [Coccidioides posadasii RMSCC 3488]